MVVSLLFQSDGNAGFLRAARDGNLSEVLEYLKGSTDINTSNPVGHTLIGHITNTAPTRGEGHINKTAQTWDEGHTDWSHYKYGPVHAAT